MVTIFTTMSGTTYRMDENNNTLVRLVSPSLEDREALSAELRRDGEEIKILSMDPLEVGYPAIFILDIREDGIPTIRRTTTVTSIREEN